MACCANSRLRNRVGLRMILPYVRENSFRLSRHGVVGGGAALRGKQYATPFLGCVYMLVDITSLNP